MADKAIGELSLASILNDDSLLVIEQQGEAKAIRGELFKKSAVDAVSPLSRAAQESAQNASRDARRAELARQSIVVDQEAISEAVNSAANSATLADESADEAIRAANRAQADADRATLPPVEGVYNIVLQDKATAEKYALIVEDGKIKIIGTSDLIEPTELNFIDTISGIPYALIVENAILKIREV